MAKYETDPMIALPDLTRRAKYDFDTLVTTNEKGLLTVLCICSWQDGQRIKRALEMADSMAEHWALHELRKAAAADQE